MIYTKDDEIKIVKENLKAFEGKISERLSRQLLEKQIRNTQHGLFFTLCNPRVYPHLLKSIDNIKIYNKPKYFPKAIKKLTSSFSLIDQQAAVAEIIAVGYYFHKFYQSRNIVVEWERQVPNSKKVMDISLIGTSKPVNIEVTAKDRDDRQNKHFNLRYKVKVALEKTLENLSDQKYSYIFSLVSIREENKEKNNDTITLFSEKNIEDFVNFVLQKRSLGSGKYNFEPNGVMLATVTIAPLNKVKTEFAAGPDMWSGFMKDEKRIRNRVVDKAEKQLPKNEVNFVFVPNFGDFDEIDYQEAFFGKEQWHINMNKPEMNRMTRRPDGIIQVIAEKHYSPVYGIIWSGWNYEKKHILVNPLLTIQNDILEMIK